MRTLEQKILDFKTQIKVLDAKAHKLTTTNEATKLSMDAVLRSKINAIEGQKEIILDRLIPIEEELDSQEAARAERKRIHDEQMKKRNDDIMSLISPSKRKDHDNDEEVD